MQNFLTTFLFFANFLLFAAKPAITPPFFVPARSPKRSHNLILLLSDRRAISSIGSRATPKKIFFFSDFPGGPNASPGGPSPPGECLNETMLQTKRQLSTMAPTSVSTLGHCHTLRQRHCIKTNKTISRASLQFCQPFDQLTFVIYHYHERVVKTTAHRFTCSFQPCSLLNYFTSKRYRQITFQITVKSNFLSVFSRENSLESKVSVMFVLTDNSGFVLSEKSSTNACFQLEIWLFYHVTLSTATTTVQRKFICTTLTCVGLSILSWNNSLPYRVFSASFPFMMPSVHPHLRV
jgi:hypothetical protein